MNPRRWPWVCSRGSDPGRNTHHSNESPWKPKEIPLGDDLILVLNADSIPLSRDSPHPPHENTKTRYRKKSWLNGQESDADER